MKRFSLKKCLISTVLASVMGFQTVLPAVHAEEEYGVDVSRYQGNINWDQIKNDGMSFVILRAGTTRYGIDSEFEKYYEGQSHMVVDFWMPNKSWKGCNVNDPSARVLSNYGASGE